MGGNERYSTLIYTLKLKFTSNISISCLLVISYNKFSNILISNPLDIKLVTFDTLPVILLCKMDLALFAYQYSICIKIKMYIKMIFLINYMI